MVWFDRVFGATEIQIFFATKLCMKSVYVYMLENRDKVTLTSKQGSG